MNEKPRLTIKAFTDLLAHYGIVDEAAFIDPEGYDKWLTYDACVELLTMIREYSTD
jgi:hypothetical protein